MQIKTLANALVFVTALVIATPPACFISCINNIARWCPNHHLDFRCMCDNTPAVIDCLVDICPYGNFFGARDHFWGTCVERLNGNQAIPGRAGSTRDGLFEGDEGDWDGFDDDFEDNSEEDFDGGHDNVEDFTETHTRSDLYQDHSLNGIGASNPQPAHSDQQIPTKSNQAEQEKQEEERKVTEVPLQEEQLTSNSTANTTPISEHANRPY